MTRHSRAQPADPAPSPGPRDDTQVRETRTASEPVERSSPFWAT